MKSPQANHTSCPAHDQHVRVGISAYIFVEDFAEVYVEEFN